MEHHVVSNVDSHMRRATCVIGPLKENQVTGLCLRRGDTGTNAPQTFRAKPSDVPTYTAMIDYPVSFSEI